MTDRELNTMIGGLCGGLMQSGIELERVVRCLEKTASELSTSDPRIWKGLKALLDGATGAPPDLEDFPGKIKG